MSEENGMSRRAMLVKLGIVLNGIVGAALAVPIVRFLLSPVTREKKFGYESWLSLGGLEQFQLARLGSPLIATLWSIPGTAKPATLLAGCGMSTIRPSRFSPSIARTSDARCAGSRNRACSCVPATAARTTRTDPVLQDLPSADYSSTTKD